MQGFAASFCGGGVVRTRGDDLAVASAPVGAIRAMGYSARTSSCSLHSFNAQLDSLLQGAVNPLIQGENSLHGRRVTWRTERKGAADQHGREMRHGDSSDKKHQKRGMPNSRIAELSPAQDSYALIYALELVTQILAGDGEIPGIPQLRRHPGEALQNWS